MAYTSIDNPELYFQTKLYTGNGGTQSITLDGSENMQPDWVWIKVRSQAHNHYLYDAVRGVQEKLSSNTNGAEIDMGSTGLTAFNSDGFSIGNDTDENASGQTYASWNWKESATAGFDIVSYTGTGSAKTVSHNLGVKPDVIICKSRSGAEEWRPYFSVLGATKGMRLNGTNAEDTDSGYWNNTEPTSSVFTVGTNGGTNGNGVTFIAYCFADVKGYSKFGSYTGNGNADGTFVYTGFKPAFFLCKDIDNSNDWVMFDNKRDPHNVVAEYLRPNLSNAASSSTNYMDFTSNGIKHRVNDTWNNGSGRNYIYMAFAESPFTNSNGVPNNAR